MHKAARGRSLCTSLSLDDELKLWEVGCHEVGGDEEDGGGASWSVVSKTQNQNIPQMSSNTLLV